MKIIVCGGRDYSDRETIFSVLDRLHAKRHITMLANGAATGADSLSSEWAKRRYIETVQEFTANWKAHGKLAGPIRNLEMLVTVNPDGVVAFPGGRGTANMIHVAESNGYKVWRPCG